MSEKKFELVRRGYSHTYKDIAPYISHLESQLQIAREALRIVDEVWTRANNPDTNFLGDDEHEAWSKVKDALRKIGEGEK